MLKTILVVFGGNDADHPSIDFAIRLAAEADAMLIGLGVIDESQISPAEPMPIGGGSLKLARDAAKLHEQRQAIQNRLSNLAVQCAKHQVAFKPLESLGEPAEELAVEAQRFDLIVMPRYVGDGSSPDDHGLANALYTILRTTPRPVIAVSNLAVQGQSVVIAFDGSLQAARALQIFESTGMAAKRPVHVVSLDDDQVEAARRGDRATDFLSHHGIASTLHAAVRSSNPAEQMIELAHRLDAGLLVMGAYGQPRFREFLLGSVTKTLMKKCVIPLFLYH